MPSASARCGNGKIFGLVAPGYQMAEAARRSDLRGESAQTFVGRRHEHQAQADGRRRRQHRRCARRDDRIAAEPAVYRRTSPAHYKKLVISADRKTLLGARAGRRCRRLRQPAAAPASNGDPAAGSSGGSDPAGARRRRAKAARRRSAAGDAMICSCNNVTKGASARAVDAGATTIGAMKKCTKAATSCGGCVDAGQADSRCRVAARRASRSTTLCASTSRTRVRSCST